MVVTFLRHGSNIWLVLGLLALIGGFIAGLFPFSLLWVVIGALTFYVSEYGFHRFGFHAEPSRFPFIRKMQHRLHYDHHAEPARLDLLFLPIWFPVPNLAITALGFAIIFGWVTVAPAMFGVLLAIFHYEWVHYVAHIPYQRRPRIGRWVKQYHLRHHFISEKFWFGVSNPSMDFVGRTYRGARDVERSSTTQRLYSWWSDSDIRIRFWRPLVRMLESKEPRAEYESQWGFGFGIGFTCCSEVRSECQIRSTSAAGAGDLISRVSGGLLGRDHQRRHCRCGSRRIGGWSVPAQSRHRFYHAGAGE